MDYHALPIDSLYYDSLIEGQVSVDSVLYIQLNEINPNVNIKAFYYLAVYCATIVL